MASGASVSFLPPLSVASALAWWRDTIDAADERAMLFVARDAVGIVVEARLMLGLEEAAQRAGYRLLTLDTRRGDAAERLYRRTGWTVAGAHDTVTFYKVLAG